MRHGLTLLEVAVGLLCLLILIGLMLPAVRSAREAARRMACSNNLKQTVLAINSYHDAFQRLPCAMAGTGVATSELLGNANRLSGFVALLPYLEQVRLWERIESPLEVNDMSYPAMGPAPWVETYPPWNASIPTLLCPSSIAPARPIPTTNYAFCIGDVTEQLHAPTTARGAFACGQFTRLEDITDGTSHTIAFGEIGNVQARTKIGQVAVNQAPAILTNPSLCLNSAQDKNFQADIPLSRFGRGGRWTDGAAPYGLFATILAPNSSSCSVGEEETADGIYSSGSHHTGGIQAAMADGSVHFISQQIDVGDSTLPPPTTTQFGQQPTPSPYGVWGALGTRDAGDVPQVD